MTAIRFIPLAFLLACPLPLAAEITVTNSSFETGNNTTIPSGWTGLLGSGTAVSEASSAGGLNGAGEAVGSRVLQVNVSSNTVTPGAYQNIAGTSYLADSVYTLTYLVGMRTDGLSGGDMPGGGNQYRAQGVSYTVSLLAADDGALLASYTGTITNLNATNTNTVQPTIGSMIQKSLVLDTDLVTAAIGEGVRIRFSANTAGFTAGSLGSGAIVSFDDVKLSYVPESSSVLLGGIGMLALLRRRRA